MKKEKRKAFGKNIYLLGKDKDGIKYWLEEANFDCGWYWGFGYVETYTNNNNPEKARDIKSHQHFDSLFLKENVFDSFKNLFVETPLTNEEIWQILDYMKEFYIMKEYSNLLHCRNHIISNEKENQKEYERINKKILPELFKKIYNLLY